MDTRRRSREIALNNPRLWTHIDFTKLTAAAMADMRIARPDKDDALTFEGR
jgi:hypothetical protein